MLVGRAIHFLKLLDDPGLLRICHHPSLKGSRNFSEAEGITSTLNRFVVLLVHLIKRHARELSFRLCEHPMVFDSSLSSSGKAFMFFV